MLVLLTVLTVACMAVLPFLGIDRGVLAALELLRRFLAMLLSGERKSPETEELPEGEPGIQPGFFGGGEVFCFLEFLVFLFCFFFIFLVLFIFGF